MTETEKAQRRARMEARKEARKAADAAHWEQERIDKALMLDALRDVLKDKTASPAQRLYAVACLDHSMGYHVAPCDLKYPDSRDDADLTRLRATFAAELAKVEGTADAATQNKAGDYSPALFPIQKRSGRNLPVLSTIL